MRGITVGSVVLCLALGSRLAAQVPAPPAGSPPPAERPGAADEATKSPAIFQREFATVSPKDDEQQRLLKERFNLALKEMKDHQELSKLGTSSPVPLFECVIARVVPSGLELFTLPAERIAFLEEYVEATRYMEVYADTVYNAGQGSHGDRIKASYSRKSAEIQLLKARRELKLPKR